MGVVAPGERERGLMANVFFKKIRMTRRGLDKCGSGQGKIEGCFE